MARWPDQFFCPTPMAFFGKPIPWPDRLLSSSGPNCLLINRLSRVYGQCELNAFRGYSFAAFCCEHR